MAFTFRTASTSKLFLASCTNSATSKQEQQQTQSYKMASRIDAVMARLCCGGTYADDEEEQEQLGGEVGVSGDGIQSGGEQGNGHGEGITNSSLQNTLPRTGKGKSKDALSPEDLAELSVLVNKSNLVNPRISRTYLLQPIIARDLNEPEVFFHLVRHGQVLSPTSSMHNVPNKPTDERSAIFDPTLTSLGIDQCSDLRASFPYMDQINYVLSSPMRRCLQTTAFSFTPLFTKDINTAASTENATIIAWSDLREVGDQPCNRSMGIKGIKEVTTQQNISTNVSLLISQDWGKFDDKEGARAERVRRGLYEFRKAVLRGDQWKNIDLGGGAAQQDVHVLVVAHGNLLSEVLGFSPGVNRFRNTWVKTCTFAGRALANSKAGYILKETVKNDWQALPREMEIPGGLA